VIASRGIRDLPTRLKIGGAAVGTVALPDGGVGELEPLDGGGAIVWLRRRSRPPAPRLRLHLLGHGASAQLGTGQPERRLRSLELLAVLAMHPEGMTQSSSRSRCTASAAKR